MATEIFVDTSGFYALLVRRDDRHAQAVRILRRAAKRREVFVTTDYVLDETATLLVARGHAHLVQTFLDDVLASTACSVVWMDPDRFADTRGFFSKHLDHAWSFTDCFSFVVMKDRKASRALTKDGHFREAGFVPLLG